MDNIESKEITIGRKSAIIAVAGWIGFACWAVALILYLWPCFGMYPMQYDGLELPIISISLIAGIVLGSLAKSTLIGKTALVLSIISLVAVVLFLTLFFRIDDS